MSLIAAFRAGGNACPSTKEVLSCHAAFAARAQAFDQSGSAIIAELGLSELSRPEWWADLITAAGQKRLPDQQDKLLMAIQARMEFAMEGLPRLMSSLQPPTSATTSDARTVTIILEAENGRLPQPARLATAIESVAILWDALCDLHDTHAPLAVVGCDPDGGTRISFAGDAAIVAELKALLLSIWEQVLLQHDLSLSARLSLIPPSTPIMDRIARTPPAEAADLRRRVQDGIRQFLTAGATTSDMRIPDYFTPAKLMRASGPVEEPTPASAAAPVTRPLPPVSADGLPAVLIAVIAEERQEMQAGQAPVGGGYPGSAARPVFRTVTQD